MKASRPQAGSGEHAPVLFSTLPAAGGCQLGLVTLNQPHALNGLSLDMARAMSAQLAAWESDPTIAMVIMRGAGEKAFCAGGDLQAIYPSLPQTPYATGWQNEYLRTFFQVEYTLDYQIHCYSKPVLCWANGIVMGGGAGLMMGASHRVCTETTRFAMPEIVIGLFPDVAGNWLLNRMPQGVGRFLALTGSIINASDSHYLGIVNHRLASSTWPVLLQRLQAVRWHDNRASNDALLDACLDDLKMPALPPGPVQQHAQAMADWANASNWRTVYRNIAALESADDPWLVQSAQRLRHGCPAAIALAFQTLTRAKTMSLAQVFQMEYTVALNATARSDFREGIRALLIEKTGNPRWSPPSIEQVDDDVIATLFEPTWPASQPHPLATMA